MYLEADVQLHNGLDLIIPSPITLELAPHHGSHSLIVRLLSTILYPSADQAGQRLDDAGTEYREGCRWTDFQCWENVYGGWNGICEDESGVHFAGSDWRYVRRKTTGHDARWSFSEIVITPRVHHPVGSIEDEHTRLRTP